MSYPSVVGVITQLMADRKAIETVCDELKCENDALKAESDALKARIAVLEAGHKTLYVSVPVSNALEISTWAREAGIPNLVPPEKMHVTLAASKVPVDWRLFGDKKERMMSVIGGKRRIDRFGDSVVLVFEYYLLDERHAHFVERGAVWPWPKFEPHITLTYDGADVDIDLIDPYGEWIELGDEKWETFDDNWV